LKNKSGLDDNQYVNFVKSKQDLGTFLNSNKINSVRQNSVQSRSENIPPRQSESQEDVRTLIQRIKYRDR
jgi:hypothetical protein